MRTQLKTQNWTKEQLMHCFDLNEEQANELLALTSNEEIINQINHNAMKSEMKRFSLIKTKYGERKGQELTYFLAPSIDHMLLVNVKTYLHVYLSTLTAMTFDEITKALQEFDGSISYDNYVIELTENQ